MEAFPHTRRAALGGGAGKGGGGAQPHLQKEQQKSRQPFRQGHAGFGL